jgi:hypothetical protein
MNVKVYKILINKRAVVSTREELKKLTLLSIFRFHDIILEFRDIKHFYVAILYTSISDFQSSSNYT